MRRRTYELAGHRATLQLHDHPTDHGYRGEGAPAWNGRDLVLHVQLWRQDDQVPEATWLAALERVERAFRATEPEEGDLGVQLLHYEDQVVLVEPGAPVSDDLLAFLAANILREYLEGVDADRALARRDT